MANLPDFPKICVFEGAINIPSEPSASIKPVSQELSKVTLFVPGRNIRS